MGKTMLYIGGQDNGAVKIFDSDPDISSDSGNIIQMKSDGLYASATAGTVRSITSAELATMWKDNGVLTLSKDTVSITGTGETDDVDVTATGTVTALTSDPDVATVTVDSSGDNPVLTVTSVGEGTALITVTSAETTNYKPVIDTITVVVTVS